MALFFLVIVPVAAMVIPAANHEGEDSLPLLALLTTEVYGPVFPFFFSMRPALGLRVGATVAEVLLLVAAFAWFSRHSRLREQVMYAMMAMGALATLMPFVLSVLLR